MKNNNNFTYQSYEIISKEELTSDTFLFRMKGHLSFIPGQFVQVTLPHFGEATFAPCSDSEEKKLIKLLPGDEMKVRGPYGNGWPIAKIINKNVLLIAGGLGIVPLRPIILQILKYQSEFKKIYLTLGFKSDLHILFEKEIIDWKEKLDYLKVYVEHGSRNFWGDIGMVTEPLGKLSLDKKNTVVLMCGPEVMCPYCNDVLLNKGIDEKNIFISYERRMECGIGVCQHCNIGKYLVCRDGPVFSLDKIKEELGK